MRLADSQIAQQIAQQIDQKIDRLLGTCVGDLNTQSGNANVRAKT